MVVVGGDRDGAAAAAGQGLGEGATAVLGSPLEFWGSCRVLGVPPVLLEVALCC